ncbi:MAG: TrkH family potassium uptake protein [Bacillota bacterium]|nr:TrkH family potassium uptake protein [Bacillota bacterium]
MAALAGSKHWGPTPPQTIVLSFALAITVGTVLLSLPAASASGESIGLINAYFMASSATCVTGLVVVPTGAALSLFGQLTILALIQIGGLGLMTLATFFYALIGRRITLRGRLLIQESLGRGSLSGLVRLLRSVFAFTVVCEAIGAALLTARFALDMPLPRAAYFGVFHAVSAFCNAGFDLFGDSLERFASDPLVVLTVTGLIIIGGLGFLVLQDIVERRKDGRLTLHTRIVLRVTGVLLASAFALIFLMEYRNPGTLGGLPAHGKFLSAWFMAVTPRTAGFNTVPTAMLRESTILLVLALMFVGASPAGTGGGIKTTTAWVFLGSMLSTLRGRHELESGGRSIPRDLVERAHAIGVLSTMLVLAVAGVLMFTEHTGFVSVLFETMSAFGTVGLSLGITAKLSTIGRILIPLTMLAGRVGPITLAVALGPPKANSAGVHYPPERVLVG